MLLLILPLLVGSLSGYLTRNKISGSYKIKKPSFNPPNYIFGPVWITLYI
jgi:translocator protein